MLLLIGLSLLSGLVLGLVFKSKLVQILDYLKSLKDRFL